MPLYCRACLRSLTQQSWGGTLLWLNTKSESTYTESNHSPWKTLRMGTRRGGCFRRSFLWIVEARLIRGSNGESRDFSAEAHQHPPTNTLSEPAPSKCYTTFQRQS